MSEILMSQFNTVCFKVRLVPRPKLLKHSVCGSRINLISNRFSGADANRIKYNHW